MASSLRDHSSSEDLSPVLSWSRREFPRAATGAGAFACSNLRRAMVLPPKHKVVVVTFAGGARLRFPGAAITCISYDELAAVRSALLGKMDHAEAVATVPTLPRGTESDSPIDPTQVLSQTSV